MSVDFPRRLDLAQLPTPILRLDRTSAAWGGPRLWIKRDDDTGGLLSGNKIRKLQYIVREALDRGADTLVTCGGLQSNHCRATAAVARRLGLDVVLCLRGEPGGALEGNYLLDRILGAEIRCVSAAEYERVDEIMAEIAADLERRGRRAHVIAEGASTATGAWGYIEACAEIAATQSAIGTTFDAIVVPVGSGGTAAGLVVGARLFGLGPVVGMAVCDDAAYFRRKMIDIVRALEVDHGFATGLREQDIDVVDRWIGAGYGRASAEELAFQVEFARREGIVLDPVYTGKALYGLWRELEVGSRFSGARDVLFVHTGGIFGVAPYADRLVV